MYYMNVLSCVLQLSLFWYNHMIGIIHSFIWIMIHFSQSAHRLPTPYSGTNQTVFSETRALQLLHRLSSEIGVREVGMKSNEIETPQYLMSVIHSLMSVAEVNGWKLEVELETDSGAVAYYFVHTQFTNVYLNITNVVISLTPNQVMHNRVVADGIPAFLLGAHYDGAFRSPAASDDGVPVAVILETIRCLVNQPAYSFQSRLLAVLNGAEETYLVGSHAFVTNHRWAKDVIGFINLEAMGSGGAEILFQSTHKNDWVLRLFAK